MILKAATHFLTYVDIPLFDVASLLDPRVKDSEHFTLEDDTEDKLKELMTDVLMKKVHRTIAKVQHIVKTINKVWSLHQRRKKLIG